MKKLFLFIFGVIGVAGMCLGAGGNAPTKATVDGYYEMSTIKHTDHPNKILFTYGTLGAGLDTLDGADSVQLLNDFNPKLGWEYILKTAALSGDSAATIVAQVLVKALGSSSVTLSHTILDSVDATNGSSIRIPFGEVHSCIGNVFDVYLKSENASSEGVVTYMQLFGRKVKQTQTIR